ncbi:3-isopropylmalate dehydratase small subunit [Rhodosalinus sp.]|uniref:3-isopropylmalate dehydratase small subunit n=1 Tax=Rhodosalinus sp. TaxID=2047741 RepID=UPI0035612BBA
MRGWTRHDGLAVALPVEGIDTDQLIPARFMSRPRAAGYGAYLLHDMRRDGEGRPDPEFPLERPEAAGASILVARRNFGGGSSREAAVYALIDAGFRAVVAPSFGDIFAGNAVNNGLLPAQVSAEDAERLLAALAAGPLEAEVDIDAGAVTLGGLSCAFALSEAQREKLANGWDDIDVTRRHEEAIAAHRATLAAARPWLWPRAARDQGAR